MHPLLERSDATLQPKESQINHSNRTFICQSGYSRQRLKQQRGSGLALGALIHSTGGVGGSKCQGVCWGGVGMVTRCCGDMSRTKGWIDWAGKGWGCGGSFWSVSTHLDATLACLLRMCKWLLCTIKKCLKTLSKWIAFLNGMHALMRKLERLGFFFLL